MQRNRTMVLRRQPPHIIRATRRKKQHFNSNKVRKELQPLRQQESQQASKNFRMVDYRRGLTVVLNRYIFLQSISVLI